MNILVVKLDQHFLRDARATWGRLRTRPTLHVDQRACKHVTTLDRLRVRLNVSLILADLLRAQLSKVFVNERSVIRAISGCLLFGHDRHIILLFEHVTDLAVKPD